ncbi:hypothetical protein [Pseudoxanthomonas sp. LARHCG66]
MNNADIVADMKRADLIKSMAPDSGVSVDAIFHRLATPVVKRTKAYTSRGGYPAPDWFNEALEAHKGQRVSIRRFMILCGRPDASFSERRDVGAWLRASGRFPASHGGELRFRI